MASSGEETADCKVSNNNRAKRKSYKPRKVVIGDESGATKATEQSLRKSARLRSKARTVTAESPKKSRNRKPTVRKLEESARTEQSPSTAGDSEPLSDKDDGDCESLSDGDLVSERTKKAIVHKKRPCEVCGRAYNTFYLKVHMRKHTGEKPFQCQVCLATFSTESLLRTHFQRYHGNTDELQCGICRKIFASKGSLKIHKQIHSDVKPYKCVACGKEFKQPGVLNEHLKTHNNDFPFQCEVCGRSFKSKRSVFRHKESAHDGVKRTFLCTVCGKIFHDKSSLWRHQKRHETGYTKHMCEVCGKQFHERKVLSTHMLIHDDVKPFQCHECHKFFRHYSVLKRHLSVHTGVKPFRCERCQRQFIHRVYLVRHKCTAPFRNLPPPNGDLENSIAGVVSGESVRRVGHAPQPHETTYAHVTQPEMQLCEDKPNVLLELKDVVVQCGTPIVTLHEMDAIAQTAHCDDVIGGQFCTDGFDPSCEKSVACQIYTETISSSVL